ncbi:nickel-dependent lactate racemase [Candidatus Bathyarchaeota archaeon]|nr:nickel-dependent lactate racemase [Candidatus Bathyarchaeota archaeon]
MKVKLLYGEEHVEVRIRDENLMAVLRGSRPPDSQNEIGEVKLSLENPIAGGFRRGSKALLLVTDYTRPTPLKTMLPPIFDRLRRLGYREFTVLVANGLHEPASKELLEEFLGSEVFEYAEVVNHDVSKRDELTYVGETSMGTPLWVNSRLFEADLRVGCGVVEPHFFAGYGGGGKIILPGVSGEETVYKNHSYAMIAHPKARLGVLDGNPVYSDICEAASMAGLDAVVNVVLGSGRGVSRCFTGRPIETHRAAVDFLDKFIRVKVEAMADIAVVSGGGYPADRNLYQAVKGMAVGELIVKPRGVIVLMAECRDGVAHEHFYRLVSRFDDPSSLLEYIREHEPIRDQWEAQIMARILQKHKIIVYAKGVNRHVSERMMLIPASSPEEAMEIAFNIAGKDAKTVVVPEGTHIIPDVSSKAK